MLYLVYAESANYCGYGQHFVVKASSEADAEDLVIPPAEEYFCEQDSDQLEEEYGSDFEGPYSNIVWIEEFGPFHDSWKFYQDPTQEEFYIKVNLT